MGGQAVVISEQPALVETLNQIRPRPMSRIYQTTARDTRTSDAPQENSKDNWKSIGEIAADIARRIAEKDGAK